jgi:enoyl-CoA hydratase/carnithine racemase
VAWLTLRRPDKLNALSTELLEQGADTLRRVGDDDTIRCVIVHGEGRAFCAGADLNSMTDLTPSRALRRFAGMNLWQVLADVPQPTIAAVHGYCFGGGCELALACDFRLAAEDAQFGQPEIKVGIIPGAGGTQRLPRLVGMTKAKEMVLLGEPIDAAEAYRIGLVNRVVPTANLLSEAQAWADRLAKLPPMGVRAAKSAMNRGADLDLRSALEVERLNFSVVFGTEDQREGVRAFLEKRPPEFKGR